MNRFEKTGKSRCLFVMEDHPISPNAPGGGPVLMYSRLELLAHSDFEINLLLLRDPLNSYGFSDYVETQPDMWRKVESWCVSHRLIHLSHITRDFAQMQRLKRFYLALKDPASYLLDTNVTDETITVFREVVARIKPDLIWAENLIPAVLAWRSSREIPIIYGHHDWMWRVNKLNYKHWLGTRSWRYEFKFWMLRRIERSLVRQVVGCISASASEAAEVSNLNSKHVAYFPTTYLPTDLLKVTPVTPARIIHLGGMGTVANRIGLQRFLEVAWPIICESLSTPPELWVIGSMKGASESLLTKLNQVGAICTGFVQDLSSVLHPYDIHIIPWENNTGTRTRIPLILNHAQVLVSTRAAAVCLPELKDGENCVLVDDLNYMGQAILALLFDEPRRKQIAQSGRTTFMKHFTQEAIQPRFDQFLNELRFDCSRNGR